MDGQNYLFPRFMRLVHPSEYKPQNKMRIPPPILTHFGAEMPETVIFELPNGEKTHVRFDREDGIFKNVLGFFKKFRSKYGICAVFTYKGNGIFMVNVLNEYLTEVEYDPPTYDKLTMVGCKAFSLCKTKSHAERGLVALSPAFFKRFAHLLPSEITVTLPNGQTFIGSYSPESKISGLRFFEEGDIIVLTYLGDGRFEAILFGPSLVEKSYSVNEFKVGIVQSHLLNYCYGIELAAKFKSVAEKWHDGDVLEIKDELNNKTWHLQVKATGQRIRIQDRAWVGFAKSLGLEVGDVLVFTGGPINPRKFNVICYKKNGPDLMDIDV